MEEFLRGLSFAVIVISTLAARGHYQGNDALRKDTQKPDQRDVLNHLQNYNTIREVSPREKTHKDDNLPRKRDRSPPKSPHFSSLETEEMIARAKTVLQAIREQGCPTNDEDFFNITVYTADLLLAGTTSQVYINIYGMMYGLEESTAKIHLTNHDEKEFTRGRVDSFLVKTKFVGLVERITIEHDNTGIFPDWNLDKVVVHDLKLGTVQTFMCKSELSGYENEVTLPPI